MKELFLILFVVLLTAIIVAKLRGRSDKANEANCFTSKEHEG
jgi:hypothetical protein